MTDQKLTAYEVGTQLRSVLCAAPLSVSRSGVPVCVGSSWHYANAEALSWRGQRASDGKPFVVVRPATNHSELWAAVDEFVLSCAISAMGGSGLAGPVVRIEKKWYAVAGARTRYESGEVGLIAHWEPVDWNQEM